MDPGRGGVGWGGIVSWSDSGARTGPREMGLIAQIAARNDEEAARRIYLKYHIELLKFGVHVLRDNGLTEEMVQETFIRFCQRARRRGHQEPAPQAEPSAGLEDRTVAAMISVLARQKAEPTAPLTGENADDGATRPYPVPQVHHAAEPVPSLARQPLPASQPAPAQAEVTPAVTRLPSWRRNRGRLAAVVASAAAIVTAAIVLPLGLGGGRGVPAGATAVIPLHATTAARLDGFGGVTGRATASQDASGSWTISLTAAHLNGFGDRQWYTCWYVNRNGQATSGFVREF